MYHYTVKAQCMSCSTSTPAKINATLWRSQETDWYCPNTFIMVGSKATPVCTHASFWCRNAAYGGQGTSHCPRNYAQSCTPMLFNRVFQNFREQNGCTILSGSSTTCCTCPRMCIRAAINVNLAKYKYHPGSITKYENCLSQSDKSSFGPFYICTTRHHCSTQRLNYEVLYVDIALVDNGKRFTSKF